MSVRRGPAARLALPRRGELLLNHRSGRWEDRPRDAREEMIAETSAFLSWALREKGRIPRIPRRRVDEGGFTTFMKMPGAWAAVSRWWDAALDQLG